MIPSRDGVRAAVRPALFAFCAFTSFYCLLCSVPFVWTNFLRDGRYPVWVGWFVRGHGPLALLLAALGASALRGRARAVWGAPFAALALAAAATGWLNGRGDGASALVLAFAAWIPYLAWELAAESSAGARPAPRAASAPAVAAAAASCAAVYALAARPASAIDAAAAAWSAIVHLELFFAAALALDAARLASRLARDPARAETAARRVLAWLVVARALVRVFSSLAFTGPAAWAYAALASAAATAALARSPDVLAAAARAAAAGPVRRAAAFAAMAAYPWAVRAAVGPLDWNRLFESTGAVALWAFAAAFRAQAAPPPASQERGRRSLWAGAAAVVLLAWAAHGAARAGAPFLRLRRVGLDAAIARLQADEVSLSTARRILARPPARGDFFSLLQEHTNLPRAAGRGARPLDLSSFRGPGLARKPHVFLFVVDSLRPDYLGAYEPKVRFTPAIDAFAKDAVVFRRAFSAYGGTGLSEPSIWAGARLPHMQYPSPFPPMDALEKLVDREGFRPLITVDVILGELLKPEKRALELDRDTFGNYKLCGTLAELEGRLDAELASGAPLFVYTQPQDLHVSVIQREGGAPLAGAPAYPGFSAPYASRVAALDACFGRFVTALKARGIYDDSLIVLTSDHGDSLGEGGRWGHAYTLYPEILRVPLVIRAPARLLAGRAWDADAAAFLTDLTPTLYALLGREPEVSGEPFGRPLFARDRGAFAAATRPSRVAASSYGPVYGVLGGAGESLVVFDGVNRETLSFDLAREPRGESPRPDPDREERARAEVRASLDALRAFYGY